VAVGGPPVPPGRPITHINGFVSIIDLHTKISVARDGITPSASMTRIRDYYYYYYYYSAPLVVVWRAVSWGLSRLCYNFPRVQRPPTPTDMNLSEIYGALVYSFLCFIAASRSAKRGICCSNPACLYVRLSVSDSPTVPSQWRMP